MVEGHSPTRRLPGGKINCRIAPVRRRAYQAAMSLFETRNEDFGADGGAITLADLGCALGGLRCPAALYGVAGLRQPNVTAAAAVGASHLLPNANCLAGEDWPTPQASPETN